MCFQSSTYIDSCEQRGVVSVLAEEEKVGGDCKSQVGRPDPVAEELRKLNSDRVLPQRALLRNITSLSGCTRVTIGMIRHGSQCYVASNT